MITQAQLDYLKQCLTRGSGLTVYWIEETGRPREISGIGQHHDEPGPVAGLYGRDGHYIALDNVSPNEIMVMRNVTAWPDQMPHVEGAVTIGDITIEKGKGDGQTNT